MEENHLAQQPPWLLNNAQFCYAEESPTNNDNEKNQTSYSIKKIIKIPKKLTQIIYSIDCICQCVLQTRSAQCWSSRTTDNHLIFNQIYNILAELHNKGKQIILK